MTAHSTSRRPRPFAWTVLICSIGYASYFLSKAAFVVLATPLLILLGPFPNTKYRLLQTTTRRFLAVFARRWLPALGIYRIVEISGLERALAAGSAVFVANHRGYMDTLLMLSLVPRLGVLVKSRYTRRPLYALLARHFDLISLDPGRLGSIASAVANCRAVLNAKKNLLVYPEGSRARSARLQPFNTLAFDLACQAGVRVVPVIIHSTVPFMSRVPGSFFPRDRNDFRIRFLQPERACPEDTMQTLCDRVHRLMARELKTLDAGTAWENGMQNRHESKGTL